jgi:hypothetical protein
VFQVVSTGDPQKNLENFIKIGEGSTGTVWIAVEKNTSKENLGRVEATPTEVLADNHDSSTFHTKNFENSVKF